MASTNKTINYNLSQYLANDKPTYLVDYNSDMNKIDTQMKANNDLAGLAKTEADDLSSRVDGQDVIIGNINTTVGQHTTDISSLNTDVSDVNTKVGDLTDLNTTDKTDIVGAVNEVNTKVGDLTNLNTTDKTNIVSAVNEVNTKVDTKVDVYSTSEVKTDKVWIDGKPIYRKVYTSNTITNITLNLGTQNTDYQIINVYGFYGSSDTWFNIPSVRTNTAYALGFYVRNGVINFDNGGVAAGTVTIIVEYTKTTD